MEEKPFIDTMKIDHIIRRGHTVGVVVISMTTSTAYYMFLSALEQVIKKCKIENGIFSGSFAYAKKGTSWGLILKDI